jgi:hypothetical protein
MRAGNRRQSAKTMAFDKKTQKIFLPAPTVVTTPAWLRRKSPNTPSSAFS